MLDAPDSLLSGEVDPDAPSLGSLLSALEAVHTRVVPMEVLERYYQVLSEQAAASRAAIRELGHLEELEHETAQARLAVALSSIGILELLLQGVRVYLDEPSDSKLAGCIQLYMVAAATAEQVHQWLEGTDPAAKAVAELDEPARPDGESPDDAGDGGDTPELAELLSRQSQARGELADDSEFSDDEACDYEA
jgi:hypothetical protein